MHYDHVLLPADSQFPVSRCPVPPEIVSKSQESPLGCGAAVTPFSCQNAETVAVYPAGNALILLTQ